MLHTLQQTLDFDAGEKILTEISRKFTPAHLSAMLGQVGFELVRHLQPANGYFSLLLARPAA